VGLRRRRGRAGGRIRGGFARSRRLGGSRVRGCSSGRNVNHDEAGHLDPASATSSAAGRVPAAVRRRRRLRRRGGWRAGVRARELHRQRRMQLGLLCLADVRLRGGELRGIGSAWSSRAKLPLREPGPELVPRMWTPRRRAHRDRRGVQRPLRNTERAAAISHRCSASRSFLALSSKTYSASRSFLALSSETYSASRSFLARSSEASSASRSFPARSSEASSASRSFLVRSSETSSASRSCGTIDSPRGTIDLPSTSRCSETTARRFGAPAPCSHQASSLNAFAPLQSERRLRLTQRAARRGRACPPSSLSNSALPSFSPCLPAPPSPSSERVYRERRRKGPSWSIMSG